MKRALNLLLGLTVVGPLFLSGAFSSQARAQINGQTIASRTAEIDGVKLHYLTCGQGTPLILLHGYAEMSRMWKPIMPALAERFTVIAPDLPGIGDSDIPSDGLDMKSAAIRIHNLAKSLGVQKAEVVGHDIGLMVAYAYAAQFSSEVTKLVLMDAFLPGVAGWEAVYNNPNIWHFRFNGPTPEALVQVASVRTSTTSGMSSQPTRRIRFRKPIARPTRRLTRGRDECMRHGPISFRSSKPPKISLNSRRPS
jgi:pimeloyl-ACP methyl ester carboxylesterase